MRWVPEEALAACADDSVTHIFAFINRLWCVVRLSQMRLPMWAKYKSSRRGHLKTRRSEAEPR
jgi:hypothetical protein